LDSDFYAKRFVSKLIERVDQLVDFPESGRIVPEKDDQTIRELLKVITEYFTDFRKAKLPFLEFTTPQEK
jgi:hypothetical protein